VNFGEKVKQLRAERNLTQPQLAQAIGIEQSYLSKLENDKSVPSADIFQRILRAFSIDVSALLEGVDDQIVHRDLRQIPEVANHVSACTTHKIHSIRSWLFGSAIACVLGLTFGFAGWRGLLFSNTQYNYVSQGVLLPGEPTNIFEPHVHHQLLQGKYLAKLITEAEFASQVEEFNRRINQDVSLLDDYRGEAFLKEVDGGQRLYKMAARTLVERPQNRWLMFIGAVLTFGGLIGFLVEQRLRSVKL
jgi:transcriptional regulator with XRE-family HTH domain